MNNLSTEIKTRIVKLYDSEKEYWITEEQYQRIMKISETAKGIDLEGDYISFGNIKTIQEVKQEEKTFFPDFKQINRVGAIKAMIKGFDRAIKESCGTYEKAKPKTIELRKTMVKRLKELETV